MTTDGAQAARLFATAAAEPAVLARLKGCVDELTVLSQNLEAVQLAKVELARLPVDELDEGLELWRGGVRR